MAGGNCSRPGPWPFSTVVPSASRRSSPPDSAAEAYLVRFCFFRIRAFLWCCPRSVYDFLLGSLLGGRTCGSGFLSSMANPTQSRYGIFPSLNPTYHRLVGFEWSDFSTFSPFCPPPVLTYIPGPNVFGLLHPPVESLVEALLFLTPLLLPPGFFVVFCLSLCSFEFLYSSDLLLQWPTVSR